ncbi:HEPN/Toprim-associated domain-containing protein, partial [Vibrio sp. 10N.222.55.E8]
IRRLQLAGYDLNSARHDFDEVRASWIAEMRESLRDYHREDSDLTHEITANLKLVEANNFDNWLKALPRALELSQNRFKAGNFESKVQIEGEPLLSFMLSDFYGV